MDPPDSASRVFCSRILSMVNTDDVNAIILAQKNMLDRFEKTNEMLLNFNNLSSARLQQMSERFLHHTRTLVEMKRDLDSIFRRIRTLKGKLARQHPEAFSPLASKTCPTCSLALPLSTATARRMTRGGQESSPAPGTQRSWAAVAIPRCLRWQWVTPPHHLHLCHPVLSSGALSWGCGIPGVSNFLLLLLGT
ncbi:kxDL motif-containing protein 1 isoform 1-T5 [Callospermophilus lateralis]|uniref:kxDL motif-containing protein 1 isoform X1 n=1 Tax=Callospermophilus lateralis TaxID=76772 RepID=UPI004053E761